MFIKQRRVRRSEKFSSRWVRSSQRRREYMATVYTTGVVQFILIVFMLVGAYRSWVLMHTRFPDLPWYGQIALPGIMIVIAGLVARALLANIGRAREAYQRRSHEE